MPHLIHLLSIVCLLCAGAAAQTKPPADEPATLDSVASAQRPMIRARALRCFRMPDGTIWDGWAYFEQRKIIEYAVKPFDRIEPGTAAPGQTFVEDKVIGTIWKVKPTREARAWGLTDFLAGPDGEIPKGRFEGADRLRWQNAPPLWSCATQPDYAWPFAYIDESDPDDFTRLIHTGYLEITRDWGDGRFDFKGYSLDRGTLEGTVRIPDPVRFTRKDRFKGTFFLWPETDAAPTTPAGKGWRLIPADGLRLAADQLADALLSGKAQLLDWRFEIVKDKVLWKRTIHTVERAPERADPAAKPPKPVPAPVGGPDLLVLKDGRWFRGKIVRNDAQAVIIRTFVGQSEMDMTFKPDEIKEIQAPEKR